jgi:hypothetical protein
MNEYHFFAQFASEDTSSSFDELIKCLKKANAIFPQVLQHSTREKTVVEFMLPQDFGAVRFQSWLKDELSNSFWKLLMIGQRNARFEAD